MFCNKTIQYTKQRLVMMCGHVRFVSGIIVDQGGKFPWGNIHF